MEVLFPTVAAQRLCSSRRRLEARWGSDLASGLMQRLVELGALSELDDIVHLLGPLARRNGPVEVIIKCPSGHEIVGRLLDERAANGQQRLLVLAIDTEWFIEREER